MQSSMSETLCGYESVKSHPLTTERPKPRDLSHSRTQLRVTLLTCWKPAPAGDANTNGMPDSIQEAQAGSS